jgi:biopolymer transport protein ExbD
MASAGGDAGGDAISLNLNPMLDIFSILITFLLMTYSVNPENVDPTQGVELPNTKTTINLDDVPTVTVSKTEIFLNDVKVMKVSTIIDGDVPKSDQSQGAVMSLFKELEKLASRQTKLTQLPTGEKKKLGILTLEVDKDHRFKLLKRILLSAQQAEFLTVKLMVQKPQG